MDPLRGVDFIQGDFLTKRFFSNWKICWPARKLPLCFRYGPNMSGVPSRSGSDHPSGELGLEFSRNWLKPDALFWSKFFKGLVSPNSCRK